MYYNAIYETALTYADKAQIINEVGQVLQEGEPDQPLALYQKSFNLLSNFPEAENTSDVLFLQGKIAYEKSLAWVFSNDRSWVNWTTRNRSFQHSYLLRYGVTSSNNILLVLMSMQMSKRSFK